MMSFGCMISARDAHALALSAGELVRIARRVLRGEADLVKHLADERLALLLAARAVMDVQSLADDIAHLLARVQARHRVLEDHLHVRAQHGARGVVHFAGNIPAAERDSALRRVVQADDAAADGRLAGAGFADQPVRLTRIDLKGDAVDRLHRVGAGDGKVLLEALDLQKRFAHRYFAASFLERSMRSFSSRGMSISGASGCSSQVAAKCVRLIWNIGGSAFLSILSA